MGYDRIMNQSMTSAPADASLSMILVLTGIAMLSGFPVVLAAQLSAALIAENQHRAIERALAQLIPGIVSHPAFRIEDGQSQAGHPETTGTQT